MSIEKANLIAFGDSLCESPQGDQMLEFEPSLTVLRANLLALDSFIPYVETQLKAKDSLTLDFLHWAIKDSESDLLKVFLSITEITEEIILLLDEEIPLKSAEKWICLFELGKYSEKTNEILVKRGYLDIIKKTDFYLENVINLAIENSQMEIVKYFFPLQKDTYIFDLYWAATNGYLEAIKYFHGSGVKESYVEYAVIFAADCGHFEVVKFLLSNRLDCCTDNKMMDYAARNGHLEIVKWLHFNREEGCTKFAMNYAAGDGHLETVKFLHFNRTEGCSKIAMDYAAEGGHLETIKWLHFNRTEGCSKIAMNLAAENGHLEIVKWLHYNRTEGNVEVAIKFAEKYGRSEVVKFLKSLTV